jgi:hypothetical protein
MADNHLSKDMGDRHSRSNNNNNNNSLDPRDNSTNNIHNISKLVRQDSTHLNLIHHNSHLNLLKDTTRTSIQISSILLDLHNLHNKHNGRHPLSGLHRDINPLLSNMADSTINSNCSPNNNNHLIGTHRMDPDLHLYLNRLSDSRKMGRGHLSRNGVVTRRLHQVNSGVVKHNLNTLHLRLLLLNSNNSMYQLPGDPMMAMTYKHCE